MKERTFSCDIGNSSTGEIGAVIYVDGAIDREDATERIRDLIASSTGLELKLPLADDGGVSATVVVYINLDQLPPLEASDDEE